MNNKDYERFGRATLIPGMQYMVDMMQKELDYMRQSVGEDSETVRDVIEKKKLGHPKKRTSSQGNKDYWSKMTPEERRTEIARRMKVAARRKANG